MLCIKLHLPNIENAPPLNRNCTPYTVSIKIRVICHKVRRNSELRWTFVYRQNGGTSQGMSRRFVVFCFLIGYLSACFLRLPQVTAPAAPAADRVSSESHSTVRPLSPVFGESLSPESSGWPADPVAGISTAAFL